MSPPEVIPRTLRSLETGLTAGREIGAQLYVSRRGEPLVDVALGLADAGVPMTVDTINLWISMSKPVMGVAYGQLLERGRVELDDPVGKYLPEFACNGKEPVTFRHLFTHTAGFRDAWREWLAPPFWDVVATICAAPQEQGWIAGETSGYNVVAAWYLLAAVLERVDGRDYRAYTRAEIFEPLGMGDCWIGIPRERFRAYGERVAVMHFLEDGEWKKSPAWGTEAGVAVLRPGGNGHGPMRELARLYEMLLGRGERSGVRVLAPETVDLIAMRHSEGRVDTTFGAIFDRGLGVVIDSKRYGDGFNWFGPHASDATFGHQGFFSSSSFCDPDHELVVALTYNGVRSFDPGHDRRIQETLGTLYEELGLIESRHGAQG